MPMLPPVQLPHNQKMPVLGFGTYPLKDAACRDAVRNALQVGYRHVDTADIYGNHLPVGEGLRESGVPRSEIFLTTKVWRDHLKHADVLASAKRLLKELQFEYIDLLLIHWPNKEVPLAETLKALGQLVSDGLIRNYGVSNFTIKRLTEALACAPSPIAVNQVEYHPHLNQEELRQFCQEKKVVVCSYSPLAKGDVASDELLIKIGAAHKKTPAQVTLRWHLQKGLVPLPKATARERIQSNFDIWDFELSPAEMREIDARKIWKRGINWDVAEFEK